MHSLNLEKHSGERPSQHNIYQINSYLSDFECLFNSADERA